MPGWKSKGSKKTRLGKKYLRAFHPSDGEEYPQLPRGVLDAYEGQNKEFVPYAVTETVPKDSILGVLRILSPGDVSEPDD